MYGFSQDESHLLFIDCFGLTRLSGAKQVKTDRKIMGSDSAGLATVSRAGAAAASYEDLWSKSVAWVFPELKPAKRFDRFRKTGMLIHPDGTHTIVPERGKLELEPIEVGRVLLPLRLDAPPQARAKPAGPRTLELPRGGETLAPLDVGGASSPELPVSVRVAHDGTLLAYEEGTLICADFDGLELRPRWRWRIGAPSRARVEAYADRERCVLAVHRGRRWTIVERREAAGTEPAALQRFEIETLATPALAGRYVAWQPTPALVLRRDLDTGETSEHDLNIEAAKRPIELSNAGVGTIFAGPGGRLLFLCGHRESLLDLIARTEIPRKLPAKELAVRQAILDVARPYVEAARLAGVTIELGRVDFSASYSSVGITHRIAGGDSLLGAALASHSQETWNRRELPGSWRIGSYGSHGGIGRGAAASRDELVEAYTALGQAGVGFATTIGLWADRFDAHRSGEVPTDRASLGLLARALLAVIREGPGVALDYAALAARGAPSVDEALAAVAGFPRHVDALPYNTVQLLGGLFNHLHGADAARLWMHCFFELDGGRQSDFDRCAIAPLLLEHPEAAAPFRAWFRANELPEQYSQRWAFEQLRDRLDPPA